MKRLWLHWIVWLNQYYFPVDRIINNNTIPTLLAFWYKCIYFFIIVLSGVRLSPLGTAATIGLLYQPQMIDDGECEAIGGMKIGRGNRNTPRKPTAEPLCPLQIGINITVIP
jgi:hypothetical protein